MRIKKTLFRISVAATLHFCANPAYADPGSYATSAEHVQELLFQLGESTPEDFQGIENEIFEHWEDSGSAAMNLLLERGWQALQSDDIPKAVEHFSALIDHAPDFAEAWNARATAYFLMDEFGMAMADIRQTLQLNPQQFGAMSGLGMIYEILGDEDAAMRAYMAARSVHPHREDVNDAIERLRIEKSGVAL